MMNDNRMMNEDSKLRECPFCGAKGFQPPPDLDAEPYYIECGSGECSALGPNGKTRESAIAAWNTRTPTLTDSQAREIAEKAAQNLIGAAVVGYEDRRDTHDIILSAINEVCEVRR